MDDDGDDEDICLHELDQEKKKKNELTIRSWMLIVKQIKKRDLTSFE